MTVSSARRRWLASAQAWLFTMTALRGTRAKAAQTGVARPLAAPATFVRLQADAGAALFGVTRSGALWRYRNETWQSLAAGLDPSAPLAIGHGRIAGRAASGGLWVFEGGQLSVARAPVLGAHAGLCMLALGVIAVAQPDRPGQAHVLVRLEPRRSGGWAETARGLDAVLPDARPVQFDPDGAGSDDNGHIVVLGAPDGSRYRHGVLGDAIEATALMQLERHTLVAQARLDLPAPFVFEDIAPRPFQWGSKRALLTVRSGPQGAQVVVAVMAARPDMRLILAASGAPIGTANRWLSPTTDGTRILAVHTPHIGGSLHHYRHDGDRLASVELARGLANHVLGERELDISAWTGGRLLMPTQDRRSVQVFDGSGATGQAGPSIEVALPAPLVMLRSWTHRGQPGAAALLQDGTVTWVPAQR